MLLHAAKRIRTLLLCSQLRAYAHLLRPQLLCLCRKLAEALFESVRLRSGLLAACGIVRNGPFGALKAVSEELAALEYLLNTLLYLGKTQLAALMRAAYLGESQPTLYRAVLYLAQPPFQLALTSFILHTLRFKLLRTAVKLRMLCAQCLERSRLLLKP